ncbi:unnamed protein product, partial [Prorocentrum cordatum]
GSDQFEWVSTDELLSTVCGSDGQVWVQGRGRATLAKGPRGHAEHFVEGEALELSQLQWRRPKLRRLLLRDEERLGLRGFVSGYGPARRWDAFVTRQVELAPVHGRWHHVLAYPLGGDFTKALLRPSERGWTAAQREAAAGALRYLGETLASQCAK